MDAVPCNPSLEIFTVTETDIPQTNEDCRPSDPLLSIMDGKTLNLASLPTEILRQIVHNLAPSHRAYWTASFQFDPSRDYGRNRRWVHDIQSLALASKRFCDVARAELFKIVLVKDHIDMAAYIDHAGVLTRPQVAIHVRVLVFSYGIMKEQEDVIEPFRPGADAEGWEGPKTLSAFGKQYLETTKSILRATSQRLTNIGSIVYRPKNRVKPFKDYYSFTDVVSMCMSEIRLPSLRCLGICGPRLATASGDEIIRHLPGNITWPPTRPPPDLDGNIEESKKWSDESAKRQATSTWLFKANLCGVKHIEYREDYWARFHSKQRGSVRHIIESYYPSNAITNASSFRLVLRAVDPRDNRNVDLSFLNSSRHLNSLSLDSISGIVDDSLSALIPYITQLKSLTMTYVCLDAPKDRWDTVFEACREHLNQLVRLQCSFVSYQKVNFTFKRQGRIHLMSPFPQDAKALNGLLKDIHKRRQIIGLDLDDIENEVKWHVCSIQGQDASIS